MPDVREREEKCLSHNQERLKSLAHFYSVNDSSFPCLGPMRFRRGRQSFLAAFLHGASQVRIYQSSRSWPLRHACGFISAEEGMNKDWQMVGGDIYSALIKLQNELDGDAAPGTRKPTTHK
jgi:hypothetical protein